MCHQNVSCTLNPRVNFITGVNGSGKSAILTAIVVCFGASARSTSRAKALKDFIRKTHGGSAHVSVTLQNVGPEAFRPEVYGRQGQSVLSGGGAAAQTAKGKAAAKRRRKNDGSTSSSSSSAAGMMTSSAPPTLTIKRTITQSGASNYSLYDTNGTKIKPSQFKYGSAKGEVEAIKDKFNLQVSNPCCVLDQETSKKFLQGDEKEKYEFFANATLIQKMESEFATHARQVDLVESRLTQTKLRVAQLRSEKKKAERTLEDLNEVTNAEQRLADAKGRQAWYEVKVAEIKAQDAEQDLANVGDGSKERDWIAKWAAEELQIADRDRALDMKEGEVKRRLEECAERVAEAQNRLRLTEQKARDFKRRAKKKRTNIAAHRKLIDAEKKKMAAAIEEGRRRAERAAESEKQEVIKRKEKLKRAKEQLSRCKEAVADAKREQREVIAQVLGKEVDEVGGVGGADGFDSGSDEEEGDDGVEQLLAHLERNVTRKKERAQEANAELSRLKTRHAQKDRADRIQYDDDLIKVSKAIKRENLFAGAKRDSVKGPFAQYIKLRKDGSGSASSSSSSSSSAGASVPGGTAKWAYAAELALGGSRTLEYTFLCDNGTDANSLRSLIRRTLPGYAANRFTVIVYSKEAGAQRDFESGISADALPPSGLVTASKIFECKDLWVKNFLTNRYVRA